MTQLDFTTSSLTTKHLNIKERALIEYLLKTGVRPSKIAATLGVHRSTISREIKRGTVTQLKSGGKSFRIYLADYAQRMADACRSRKGRKPKFLQCERFMEYADDLMKNSHFIPDAVVGQAAELDLFAPDERVCTKTLYAYIDANILKTRNMTICAERLFSEAIFFICAFNCIGLRVIIREPPYTLRSLISHETDQHSS